MSKVVHITLDNLVRIISESLSDYGMNIVLKNFNEDLIIFQSSLYL